MIMSATHPTSLSIPSLDFCFLHAIYAVSD